MALNPRQIRFAQEYCVDFNATQAAIRAGYSEASAGQQAHELLKNHEIAAYIEVRKEELAAAAGVTVETVLKLWLDIANADPNELVRNEVECCRYCYGFGHAYQWTEQEYSRAVDFAVEKKKPAPDFSGGFGFRPDRPPVESCPECFGKGVEVVRLADTRKLKGGARKLYAGVKKTKDGVQVLTRDQDAAVANLAKFLGMSREVKEVSGPGGGPIPLAHLSAEDLADDQLAAIIKASEAGKDGGNAG